MDAIKTGKQSLQIDEEITDAIKAEIHLSLSKSNPIDCANIECSDKALLSLIQTQKGQFCLESDYSGHPWKDCCQFDMKANLLFNFRSPFHFT